MEIKTGIVFEGDFMRKLNYVGRLFDSTFRVNLHTHAFWEVVYYTEGHGEVLIADEKVPFETNDIFILPPNIPHTDYSNVGFKNYHYTFSDFGFTAVNYLKLKDTINSDFLKILEQMYMEYHLKRENWDNIVEGLFDVLQQYIISFSHGMNDNPYVTKAVRDIISNISNPMFELDSLVESIPLNKDYFRKLFYKSTGKTPLQFLMHKRITYAQKLLRTKKISGLTIKEVAWRSGFSDYYYFTRVFKNLSGKTPSQWMNS